MNKGIIFPLIIIYINGRLYYDNDEKRSNRKIFGQAENGENTVFVDYGDVVKHLKLNGRSVKAATEKPFPICDKFVNSFYIDSIFRMLKVEKLEFITNKNKPIVIKNNDSIVGVVCPIIMR